MARSVYKICDCRDQVKCKHPWWFSFKPRGRAQLRKSLDVVLERHVKEKTIAEQEAERLRIGMVDDTLPARTRELLGLPPSAKPNLPTLTVRQLLDTYRERHLSWSAAATSVTKKKSDPVDRVAYHIGAIARTELDRPTGGSAALGEWLVADVTADTLERLREARTVGDVRTRAKGSNRVGSRWMDAAVPLAMIQRWLGHTNIAQTSTYLSGTTAGEHDAMRRFEAVQAARLIPIDTGGGTPLHPPPSPDMDATPDTIESPTRH